MSNLLDKASIVTTPTAYDNGKILSVKPTDGIGDFDFTRNSSATRVNSQGLIEDVQILSSNLVTNGDFNNGSTGWTLSSAWSIGTNKAIFSDTIGGDIRTSSNVFTANKKYQIKLTVADLTSGTAFFALGAGTASNLVTYANYANGEHTFNVTAPNSLELRIYSTTSSGSSYSITNISILEITDDTNLPRIDYTGGTGHWLFEPQSTNLIPYSENFSQSNWIKQAAVILTPNQPSPDGGNNAYKVQGTIGSSYVLDGGFGAITPQSRSIYMRAETNGVIYSLGDGQSKQINVTTEWQRFEFQEISNSFYAVDFRGSGVTLNNVYIWGAQLEQNSYATSYIPTNGSTVTRLQDAAFGAGSSDLINSTEGVLYAEIAALADDLTNKQISLNNGTTDDRIQLYYSASSNQISVFYKSQSGATAFILNHTLSDITQFNKVAFKWKQNDFALWSNGVEVATQTSGVTSSADTLTKLDFQQFNGSADFFGKTKCLAVFKEALTDAELTCLTTI